MRRTVFARFPRRLPNKYFYGRPHRYICLWNHHSRLSKTYSMIITRSSSGSPLLYTTLSALMSRTSSVIIMSYLLIKIDLSIMGDRRPFPDTRIDQTDDSWFSPRNLMEADANEHGDRFAEWTRVWISIGILHYWHNSVRLRRRRRRHRNSVHRRSTMACHLRHLQSIRQSWGENDGRKSWEEYSIDKFMNK